MSFAAEPYGVFVDDLISGLTGGVTREELVFGVDDKPLRLAFEGDFVPGTVRSHGLSDGEYTRFRDEVDFDVDPATGILTFRAQSPGVPKAEATWPDRGSRFYVSYERKPEGRTPPRLTDRNPGSILRTLAETFAREYAVLSRQLEAVYRAGFVDTAEDRDLEQVAALLGVTRRTRAFAVGEVVFSRATPATADIFIPAGTLVSTSDVPAIVVETTEPRNLRPGAVSVAAPVQSQVSGADGAALAGKLTAIHRPILGIESVINPQPLIFGGGSESDDALRRRAKRALETSGRSTVGALVGALMTVDGIREQDVRIVEDHLAHPGIVKVQIAAELDAPKRARAAELIRDFRAAGIRVLHDLETPSPTPPPSGGGGGGGGSGGSGGTGSGTTLPATFFPIKVLAAVTPATAGLTAARKQQLKDEVAAVITTAIDRYGIGETVVYNKLVGEIMTVDGVYDVVVDVFPASGSAPGRANLPPSPSDRRPKLATPPDVTVRGALVALDLSVQIDFKPGEPQGDRATVLAAIKSEVTQKLADIVAAPGLTMITKTSLEASLVAVTGTGNYTVDSVSYTAEQIEDGLRVRKSDEELTLDSDQQPWVRGVNIVEDTSGVVGP